MKHNLHTHDGQARLVTILVIHLAIRQLEKFHQEAVAHKLELALQRQAIPTGNALEKVLRYEAAAERHLARALDRLERLQRHHRGELIPPPLNVNLTRRN